MDLNDYWQENKRFVTSLACGVLVFVAGRAAIGSVYDAEIRSMRRDIAQRQADLKKPMYTSAQLADARTENEALVDAFDTLRDATRFEPRPEFRPVAGQGSASNQYLRALSRVREELLARANRGNVQVDAALGMPSLSPTREAEIVRYLEALDVIETVVGMAIDARVERIERLQVRLDPGLSSREGLGEVERTRVAFTLTGTSLALTRLLTATQRPRDGRVLHVDELEMVPSRSKEDEVRLELTLVIARLAAARGSEEVRS